MPWPVVHEARALCWRLISPTTEVVWWSRMELRVGVSKGRNLGATDLGDGLLTLIPPRSVMALVSMEILTLRALPWPGLS